MPQDDVLVSVRARASKIRPAQVLLSRVLRGLETQTPPLQLSLVWRISEASKPSVLHTPMQRRVPQDCGSKEKPERDDMSDDIVRRLLNTGEGDAYLAPTSTKLLMDEAADEIERLRAENARLWPEVERLQTDANKWAVDLADAADEIERLRAREARLREVLELVVDTFENGGWPDAVVVIARAALEEKK